MADGNGVRITGGVNGTRPGFAVDTSGDVNGDGINDIFIGDPKNDRLGQDAGSVYLIYGDDFSGSITHRGDESSNTLTGSAADDAMVGGRGDDMLVGSGGFDVMYGGAGDDVMVVGDAGFHRVRGGEGFDTLAVNGGVSLDLEALRGRIDEIEQVDLSAAGADSVRVTGLDILNLSPTSNQLYVRGTAEDEVISASEHWLSVGTVDVNGTTFAKFMNGRAELFVQDGIAMRFAPFIVTETIGMPENTAVDASIGFVSAMDPDGGQVVAYAILGGDGQGLFNIDTAMGELFVTADMNYEALSTPSFTLDLQVTDDSGEIATATIAVNILDQNEMPMWTVQDQLFPSVNEHPQTGLLVGNYAAVDPDGGDEVNYHLDLTDPALVSPAVAGAFAINPTTGKLTIANGALLDFESQASHQMMLYAEDLAGLRTESLLVTFTLTDVGIWQQQFGGTFATTHASMWGTDSGVGLSTMGFVKDVDLDNTGTQTRSILGQDLVGQVQGQLHFESTIDTDSGYVDATIPFAAEVSFPDEVVPGQQIAIGLNLVTPSQSPTMSGMTPATNVDIRLDYTNFAIITNFKTFGPNTGTATADEYLIGMPGQPWTAVVQPDGSLATASTVTTTLMEFGEVDWDSYLQNLLSGTNLPSNEAENLPYPLGPVQLIVSYVLWGFTMSGDAKVDQDLSLDVNGYSAVMVFENGSMQPMTVGGDTSVTLPAEADVNGDGFVDYEIRIDIDTTFTNTSDFYGTIYKRLTFGYFDVTAFVPNCSECGTESATFGPLFDEALPVNVFQDDAIGDYPTPWPEGQSGQFPLDGFNRVTYLGSIDLAD
ncbi:MAG: cadherin domain-containing protein [Planctomycetes bacterium]|nr:cadherin domain-containing protein [Planctomycetota bacterium]